MKFTMHTFLLPTALSGALALSPRVAALTTVNFNRENRHALG